jgi:hypothetical protein
LIAWKTKKGVVSSVRTLSWIEENYLGCDKAEKIRNFIKDAHSNWGTDYFLLGGDVEIIPAREVFKLHSDLYFSDLEGTWNENCNHIFGEYPRTDDMLCLDFVDKHNGWCVSNNSIYRTFDGARSWESQAGVVFQQHLDTSV